MFQYNIILRYWIIHDPILPAMLRVMRSFWQKCRVWARSHKINKSYCKILAWTPHTESILDVTSNRIGWYMLIKASVYTYDPHLYAVAQCAAVSTQRRVTKAPPQKWPVSSVCREACQGAPPVQHITQKQVSKSLEFVCIFFTYSAIETRNVEKIIL